MGQTRTIGTTATTIGRNENGAMVVRYHATPVVTVNPGGLITLNTGGYFTHTTKSRMNQAANQFDLGYQVYQKAYAWFVVRRLADGSWDWDNPIPFDGNIAILAPING